MKIAFINCSSKKRKEKSPAYLLYEPSDLFTKSRNYVLSQNYDGYYILSALHGLLEPNKVIEPYNKALKNFSKMELVEWSNNTIAQIKAECPNITEAHFYTSIEYRKYLIPALEEMGVKCFVYLEGLGIGKKLAWFKNNTKTIKNTKSLF